MSHIRVRTVETRADAGAKVTPAELSLINEYALRDVTAEDVMARRVRLAHNQYDLTAERFPKAYLDRFADTAPGLSLLPGHNTDELPLGRFFVADVRQRLERGFPALVTDGSGRPRRLRFEPKDLRVHWLECGFYFPTDADGQAMALRIDTGVYKDVSIGFRYDDLDCDICKKSYLGGDCPHVIGWYTEDGILVTGTYSGDPNLAEMLEGSNVYKGAQQRAQFAKALRDGGIDPKALASTQFGEDLVELKWAEAMARAYGHERKAWAFGAPACKQLPPAVAGDADPSIGGDMPPVGGEKEPAPVGAPTDERRGVMPMTPDEQAAFDAAQKRAEDAEAALEAEKTAREQAESATEALKAWEPLATIGEQALQDLGKAILDDELRLTGKADDPLVKATVERLVGERDYATLQRIAAEKAAAVLEKFPTGQVGDPTAAANEPAPQSRRLRPQDSELV